MSAIIKILLTVLIIGLIGSAIGAFIPSSFTANIDNALIYFLQSLSVFAFILHVDTLYTCMQIIINAFIGYVIFIFIFWIGHFYTQ